MSQDRLRLASLTVLGGSLHGRKFEPAEVVAELLIGSDPDCHLVVDLPSISPIHARVWADLDATKVQDTRAPRGVYLNGQRVEGEAPLGKNDVIWLGPPGEAGSVCIQPRFEPWVERLPFPAAEAAPDEGLVEADSVAEVEPVLEAEALETDAAVAGEPVFDAPGAVLEVESGGVAAGAAPAPAPEDDWAIAEPTVEASAEEPPAGPPEPAAALEDDFFVAGEDAVADAAPGGAAEPEEEPLFVVAETAPDADAASAPPAPALGAGAPAAFDLPPLVATHVPKPGSVAPATPPPAPAFTVPLPPVPLPPVPTPAAPKAAEAPAPPAVPAGPVPSAGPEASPAPAAAPAAAAKPSSSSPRPVSPRPASPRPAVAARRSAARPVRRGGGVPKWLLPTVGGIVGLVVVAAASFFAWRSLSGRVHVDAVEPPRVRVGQRVTLRGGGFAPDPAGNSVLVDGAPARVTAAAAGALEVEFPAAGEAGSERAVTLVVRVGQRESKPVSVTVIQGPRLHGISPTAAMPGEEVVLAGGGWGVGATVRFGSTPAEPVAVEATRIRVVVPPLSVGPGASAPVVVVFGGVESNHAPFVVGHLPVVTGVVPPAANPGDAVQVSGLGFGLTPEANDVRVAGAPALVVSAGPEGLKVVVPFVGPGDASRSLELRVRDSAEVGRATLQVAAPSEAVEPRFVAEPFTAVAGRPHAVVTTGIGPAFVLAASGGRSAAERALEAQDRLNAAVALLRTTAGLTIEARGFDSRPVVGLAGRPELLLEVADEDAAAYNEDWTGLKGRGGAVTPGRLARWWEAVARDLVLLTVRGERPRFTAALAPEGRVLGQLFDAAQKTGRAGVPRQLVLEAKPPLRDGLRLIGLRVPASVSAPAVAALPGAPVAAATPPPPARLSLDGSYRGRETEDGQIRYLTVTFARSSGSVTYEGGITFTVPLASLEARGRDQVRFSVRMRGGMRYYAGRWDGEKLTGSLAKDAAGREVVGSFELRR